MEWLQVGRLMLAGAFAFLALVETWFLVTRGSRRHLWGALASVLVMSFLSARMVSHADLELSERIFALQVESASLLFLGAIGLVVVARTTQRKWRTRLCAFGAAVAVLGALCFADGLIIEHTLVEVSGALGTRWVSAPITNLGWTLRGTFLVAFLVVVLLVGGELRERGYRAELRVVRLAGVLVFATALNDRLGAAGIIPTVALLEVGLASFGITLAAALAQYTDRAFRALEADVEARAEELEAVLESLNDLIRALPNYVFILRSDGVQMFNPAAEERWSSTREERVALTDIAATPRDIARLTELTEGDGRRYLRLRLRDHTEHVFPCEVVAVNAVLDGEEVVVVDARDVTLREERARQVRLADRLGATGTLAAGLAHEINNPLTYISSNISFVRDHLPPGDPELVEALNDCQAGVRRVAGIVEELSQFSARQVSTGGARVPLARPLRFALRMTKSVLRHNSEVILRFDDELPTVVGDDGQLSQVFVNLLTTAADAMPDGRGASANRIIVDAKVGERAVEVVVQDNGQGMSAEAIEHIYDPFYVGEEDEGHLGLSISHGIVEHLGGELSVESAAGVGTTVRVSLPRAEPTPRPVRPITPVNVAPQARRVLAIDDEPNVLRGLQRVLSRECEVVTVPSGPAAVELLRRGEHFDVVLCDMMMPEMTGRGVLDWVMEHRPDLTSRFAIVTGGAVGRDESRFLEQAAVPVLRKPLGRGELLALIEQLAG